MDIATRDWSFEEFSERHLAISSEVFIDEMYLIPSKK